MSTVWTDDDEMNNQMCHLQDLLCFPRLWSGVSDESDFPHLEVIVWNTPVKKLRRVL